MKTQRLYAFWEYHDGRITYYNGAEVEEILDGGKVAVKGYGRQNIFRATLIVPYDTGLKIHTKIRQALHDFDEKYQDLKIDFAQTIAKALDAN